MGPLTLAGVRDVLAPGAVAFVVALLAYIPYQSLRPIRARWHLASGAALAASVTAAVFTRSAVADAAIAIAILALIEWPLRRILAPERTQPTLVFYAGSVLNEQLATRDVTPAHLAACIQQAGSNEVHAVVIESDGRPQPLKYSGDGGRPPGESTS